MTKRQEKSRFKPAASRARKNTEDARGKIRVTIGLVPSGAANPKPGNITRTFSILDATVSEVDSFLREACFGKADE